MDKIIKQAILDGRLILFLGAGASLTSKNKFGMEPPLASKLAALLAEKSGWDYNNEPLSITYAAARKAIGPEVDKALSEHYHHCSPSKEYLSLANYPWARIYTTNIDDALVNAFRENSQQNIHIKKRGDRIADRDQSFQNLDLVFLNGVIIDIDDGFIFSPEEYGSTSASIPNWYRELASDFFQATFLFIGTKLNESIFYHQIEHYKKISSHGAPKSFILTPSATDIEKESLSSVGLTHIEGTLEDFTLWLEKEIPIPPSTFDIAFKNNPALEILLKKKSREEKLTYAELFQSVIPVSPSWLAGNKDKVPSGTVRNFYRGFKPAWQDIVDKIPAELKQYSKFKEKIIISSKSKNKSLALVGPAGSGKSTFLMMAALDLSKENETVYFIEKDCKNLLDVIQELENVNKNPYYIFFDRFDPIREDLEQLWSKGKIKNATVVAAEGQNIWHNRVQPNIANYISEIFYINLIDEEDTQPILDKIRKYGPWTRLSNMTDKKRRSELFEKSRRQLLIGLLETTYGLGFEKIIENDYNSISTDEDKTFFVLVCLFTINRVPADKATISRALITFNINTSPEVIADRLIGMIGDRGNGYMARHHVYARRILESIVEVDLILSCIVSLLDSFSAYPHPVVKSLNKNQATVFKSLINHRFLKDMLRDDISKILSIYNRYEKVFENDGLYWLQYGLILRGIDDQDGAYEKLLTAYHAYPHDHTSHALAQQELILATQGNISKPNAMDHVNKAIKLLKELELTIKSDDTYPIVTMAEGHTNALRVIEGDNVARVKAKEYANILYSRMRDITEPRLKEAYDKLLRFATTGDWKDSQH